MNQLITRLLDEVRDLKQIVQRSNQLVATKTTTLDITLTAEDTYTATTEVLVRNLSDVPMLVEASVDLSNFKQTYGDYLYGLTYQLAADKDDSNSRMVFVGIYSSTGALTIGQTFSARLILTATSDFTVEVLN